MHNYAAIKEATHTEEKYRHFPCRSLFIFWTVYLQQHNISRALGHMVPQPSLAGPLVARETDEAQRRARGGVEGGGGGGWYRKRVAELSCISISALLCLYVCSMWSCLAAYLVSYTNHSNEEPVCQLSDCPRCGLARMPIVDVCLCVHVPVRLSCAGSREGINLAL